jgi:hypothetical protein
MNIETGAMSEWQAGDQLLLVPSGDQLFPLENFPINTVYEGMLIIGVQLQITELLSFLVDKTTLNLFLRVV